MKKLLSILSCFLFAGLTISAIAAEMAPATVASGPQNGKEYLEAQPSIILTWGNAELSFADEALKPSITIYQKGFEDDPDSYAFGTGTYTIVNYNGGTNNALELDLSGYTSSLDYTTFQRKIKLGEYVINIKEGFLQNAAGDLNPQQTITFKQVDELTPATYMAPATVVEGPEDGKEYLEAQPKIVLTWGDAALSYADEALKPSITIYQKGYEDDPDSYAFGTGTYTIVNYNGGTNNALELDLSGYTSRLDYTTFQRVIKLGEYVINIKEGFLQNASGDLNPQQTITFKQVDELTPATYMEPATVASGPQNGKEYLEAQPSIILTWGNAELSFADEALKPSITIYQKGYEDDPDSYAFGTGTYTIVNYNGGTNNALELDLSGYTSKLDYTTFQRVIKLGEYVINIKEGFLQNASGDLNPQQTITFKQVDELTPATYMEPATVVEGPEDGKEYLEAQPKIVLTWDGAALSFADEALKPSITIYQKGYEDDPDSYAFGTGTYTIVNYNGGTNNALELDLSGYTSKLDYTTFQRVIKLGEYVINIKEGFLQNASGDLNPQQTITFKQVDELTPATYMEPATVVEGPEDGKEYLEAQPKIVLTWDGAALSYADESLTPSITIYQKGFENDPDSFTFGTGTYTIVNYNGGTNNALELDLSGYTSKLDYTTFQRVIKLGEYVINIKEGFLQNASGDLNPQQTVTFKQVDELTPATYMEPATVVEGPEDGKEYLDAQPTIILTWDGAALSFADEALTPSITIYQKGFENDPDSFTFGTGTYAIVDYDGGTNNALELDLSGYTSRLDYTTFQRVIKLGEYVINIKEGFLQNASGDINPQQTITFKQVDELTPATYMEPATVVEGPEDGEEYLEAQPKIVLTWDGAALSYADESLTPSITIYQKGFENDPDSFTFGTGTYTIVDYDGGTNNALELDLSGYTSKLDYTTFQRVIKLGEYVINIKEGFLQNASGDLNPQQTITFIQTDENSGIGINVVNEEVIYYDLNGQQISNPEKGKIVIRISNGKSEKIVK